VTTAEIVFCSAGSVDLLGETLLALSSGQSAFIPADVGRYVVRGAGTVFRARSQL
jgi:mannose-6-phosphate isomerase class I